MTMNHNHQGRISELEALSSLGWNSNDIAIILDLPLNTVKKELYLTEKKIGQSLLDENKIDQRYSIDEHLQQKHELCINGLNSVIRELRITAAKAYDYREKKNALTLIEKCESMISDLFDDNKSTKTIGTMINHTLKFISGYKRSNGGV